MPTRSLPSQKDEKQLLFFKKKTAQCKHKHQCMTNIIRSSSLVFMNAFVTKLLWSIITNIKKIKDFPIKLFLGKCNQKNILFALQIAMMNFTYKFVLCLLRARGYADSLITPFASFMSSLWLKHETNSPGIILNFLIGKVMDFISVRIVRGQNPTRTEEHDSSSKLSDKILVHAVTAICLLGQAINFGTGIGKADNITKMSYRFLMKSCLLETNLAIKTI